MAVLGERAVVLGASMGGLLAARVLADFYDTVVVVERDELPDDPVNRRGVPQGRHGHALLARGAQILDELFPGILDELVADGAPVWDDGDQAGRDPSAIELTVALSETDPDTLSTHIEALLPLGIDRVLLTPMPPETLNDIVDSLTERFNIHQPPPADRGTVGVRRDGALVDGRGGE